MSFRKVVLLAGVALATVAFSFPASASATGTWTDEEEALKKNATIELVGTASVISETWSIECPLDVEGTLIAGGGAGTINRFEFTTSGCKLTGTLKECEVADHETHTLPASLEATTNDIDITGAIQLTFFFDHKCAQGPTPIVIQSITALLDNPTTISSVSLSGQGTIFGEKELEVELLGELEMVGGAAGRYGVH